MSAAVSRTIAPEPLGLLGLAELLAEACPSDCVVWVQSGIDEYYHFNMGAPKSEQRGDRWGRKITLLPERIQQAQDTRCKASDHDRARTFFFFEGESYEFVMTTADRSAKRRIRNFGPRALLTLYSDDTVVRMTNRVSSRLTQDIPCLDGTMIVVSWNHLRPLDRCRHVAIVPNLIIDWSARK